MRESIGKILCSIRSTVYSFMLRQGDGQNITQNKQNSNMWVMHAIA